MGDDEYYFEDDGGDGGDDGGGDEATTWETDVENKYADAKSLMDSDAAAAIAQFHEAIKLDQDHGRWTFKAYKWIARTCARHRMEVRLPEDFRVAMEYNYAAKTKQDTEKFITKFFDRSTGLSAACLRRCAEITIAFANKDLKAYDKVWFSVKYRLAQMNLTEGLYPQLEEDVRALHAWCGEGQQAEERRGTQKLMVYALEIQLRAIQSDHAAVRQLYQRAMAITSAIPPPRILGIIRESGGKMFMRQAMWTEAYEAFFQAFRSFDEAGDPRRIANLKYLFCASMLSGRKINPFDTPETRSYQHDPEIVAMVDLITACTNNDVSGFFRILNDRRNAKSLREDSFLYTYIEPLIQQIQCQAIRVLVKPYSSIRLEALAPQVLLNVKECEQLIFTMILDGRLSASIDQQRGLLLVRNGGAPATASGGPATAPTVTGGGSAKAAATAANRYATLVSIANSQRQLETSIVSKMI